MESRDETEPDRWEAREELTPGARDPALDDVAPDDGATLSRPAVSVAAALSTALGEAATLLAAVDAPASVGANETVQVERRARSVSGEAATLLADEAVTLSAGDRAPPRPLDKGAQLGRYVVLRKLGAGAMGTIYLGYDPDLDRRVALKILRGATSAENRRALLREAQAMAKLTHPNVVSVHDVGEHLGHVYVAMEFVEGATLGAWLRAAPRTWREVLDMFLRAGEGLRAAHDRGLVHRDFKPDNVMVSRGGEVMVMDFGLARLRAGASAADASVSSSGSFVADATIGRIAGTPAYMAPEQVRAQEVGPAADQFAFCVSLWEGVCRQRPFVGESFAELVHNVAEGQIRPPPAAARMPRWLWRILVRGLSPAPERRWPSMAALLAALERGRGRGRWQAALAGAAALIAVVVAVIASQRRDERLERERIAACEAEGAAIQTIWSGERAAALRAGLAATGVGFAAESADTLIPWLDAYGAAWSAGRTEACLRGFAGSWDEELLDRAGWCFEDRRLQLEATVDQLTHLERASARRAVRLATYLEPVATCLDPAALLRLPTPPLELRDGIRAIRAELNEVDRLRHAGRYEEALAVAREARARAEALGWPPLQAAARFLEGRCMMVAGQPAEADTTLTAAYFEALEAGSVSVAFRAARSQMTALVALDRHREAELWGRHAEVLASQIPDPSGLDEAERQYLLARIYTGLGDYEAAVDAGEASVALRAEVLGEHHPITAAAMRVLGLVYVEQGRPREALEVFARAAAIWEGSLGREHPFVAHLAVLRGEALLMLGRPVQALQLEEEGLAIYEGLVGENHPSRAYALSELAEVYTALGRLDEAERALQRALALRREAYGPRHATVAKTLLAMAAVDRERGRYAAARERCDEALALLEQIREAAHPDVIRGLGRCAGVDAAAGRRDLAARRWREAVGRVEASLGPASERLVAPLVGLGDTQRARRLIEEARASYTRALAIAEDTAGENDESLAPSLTGLAELALAEGDVDAALRYAERAVRVAEDAGPRRAAAARFALARALAAAGDPERRARLVAEQAWSDFAALRDEARRAEVERWLAGETRAGALR